MIPSVPPPVVIRELETSISPIVARALASVTPEQAEAARKTAAARLARDGLVPLRDSWGAMLERHPHLQEHQRRVAALRGGRR